MTITKSKAKLQKVVLTTILTKVLKYNKFIRAVHQIELRVIETLGNWKKINRHLHFEGWFRSELTEYSKF